jgi:DNA-directed RNA polymerase specialized sigma54-like protein
MKPVPNAKATSLRRFFSITMLLEYSVEEESSSDVIKRMIAVTASHKPTSDIDKGKFIF